MAWSGCDPWEKFFLHNENPEPDARLIPVGCVLAIVGTGSEMNGGSVITRPDQKLKIVTYLTTA